HFEQYRIFISCAAPRPKAHRIPSTHGRASQTEPPLGANHLADELKYNLFLKVNEPEVQHSVSNYLGKPVTNAVDVFAGLRQWKDDAETRTMQPGELSGIVRHYHTFY